MEIWPFSEGCVSCLQILRVYSPSFSTLGNKFHFSGQDWGPQHFSEQTLLLLEWLSTAGLFFSTTLAEGFLFLPSPRSPSGPLESVLHIRWPKYWSFSFSIIPSKEIPVLISFRMDWLDLLAVQGTLKSFSNTTVQKHQFFDAQLSSQSNSHIHTWPLEKL